MKSKRTGRGPRRGFFLPGVVAVGVVSSCGLPLFSANAQVMPPVISALPPTETLLADIAAIERRVHELRITESEHIRLGPLVATLQSQLEETTRTRLTILDNLRLQLSREADQQATEARRRHATAVARLDTERQNIQEALARLDAERSAATSSSASLLAAEAELAAARKRVDDLNREKLTVIRELRSGQFCSECNRSKFEIERAGTETFQQHLISVGGRAVMNEGLILQRESEYNGRISEASGQIGRLLRRLETARERHRLAELTRSAAFQERAERLASQAAANARNREEADRSLQVSLASAHRNRTSIEQLVEARSAQLNDSIAALEKTIQERIKAYDERLAELGGQINAARSIETLLRRQLQEASDPNLREFRAEQLADEEIQRANELLARWEAAETAITHDPAETAEFAFKRAFEGALGAMGWHPAETLKRRLEAEYRTRLIRRYRRLLDLEEFPAHCVTQPRLC